MHANNDYQYENWRMNSVIIPALFDSVLHYFGSKWRRQDVLALHRLTVSFWFNQNNWRSMVLAQLWLYLTRLSKKGGRCLRSINPSRISNVPPTDKNQKRSSVSQTAKTTLNYKVTETEVCESDCCVSCFTVSMRGMIITYIFIFFSPGMQKRGDNTFLWDLVIKDNGYSAIEAKVLELWASPSTNVRFPSNRRVLLQRNRRISKIFGLVPLSELEKPRRRKRLKETK